jgi:protein phosphatase
MGTTVVCARFSPTKRRLHIGHVGDSRCYRLRDGIFKQLTADHTMAELGMTGPESANLSRAVGIWSTVPIDVVVGAPLPSDIYLLCSDGLTKMLDDERIAHVLRTEEDPQAAVDRLIFFANARGGKDNITVILVRVVEPTPDA